MPGCGKSTVGAALAKKLGRKFVDTDHEIGAFAGITIPEIFSSQGESGFRHLETEALAQYGKESGLLIATGGGCVTKQENYPLLHTNGRIFWLQRDLEKLPVDGRPLSLSGELQAMYHAREPLYRQFADFHVSNNTPVSKTVDKILDILENVL
jgi:shikimate dehydrogenase